MKKRALFYYYRRTPSGNPFGRVEFCAEGREDPDMPKVWLAREWQAAPKGGVAIWNIRTEPSGDSKHNWRCLLPDGAYVMNAVREGWLTFPLDTLGAQTNEEAALIVLMGLDRI